MGMSQGYGPPPGAFLKQRRKQSVVRTQSSRWPRYRVNIRCGGGRPQEEVIPAPEEPGIGRVPYSPLGKGFLTGTINENTAFNGSDVRNIIPRLAPEARKTNQASVDLIGKIAKRKRATSAQIALAWLLA